MNNVIVFGILMIISMLLWSFLSDLGFSVGQIFCMHIATGAVLGYITGKFGYEA